jgi:hypothetical protein
VLSPPEEVLYHAIVVLDPAVLVPLPIWCDGPPVVKLTTRVIAPSSLPQFTCVSVIAIQPINVPRRFASHFLSLFMVLLYHAYTCHHQTETRHCYFMMRCVGRRLITVASLIFPSLPTLPFFRYSLLNTALVSFISPRYHYCPGVVCSSLQSFYWYTVTPVICSTCSTLQSNHCFAVSLPVCSTTRSLQSRY